MPRNFPSGLPSFIDRLKKTPGATRRCQRSVEPGTRCRAHHRFATPRRGWAFFLPTLTTRLYDAFGQRLVSTIFTQLNQYHVVLEVDPQFQQNPDSLKYIYVKSSNGTQVPLSAFTRFEPAAAALALNHQGQFPVVTLSFNLAPNVSLGRRRQRHQRGQAGFEDASQHPGHLSGHCGGVS